MIHRRQDRESRHRAEESHQLLTLAYAAGIGIAVLMALLHAAWHALKRLLARHRTQRPADFLSIARDYNADIARQAWHARPKEPKP